MHSQPKYTRIEWERRFLLDRFPSDANVTRVRRICDRYIKETTLRLRQQSEAEDDTVFKLTQKLPERVIGARQGLITSMYFTQGEFGVLARLPARILTKTRHSVPPFGIDVFAGTLTGLVLAEAEFSSAAGASELILPPFLIQEVSEDHRFTGGRLVAASKREPPELAGRIWNQTESLLKVLRLGLSDRAIHSLTRSAIITTMCGRYRLSRRKQLVEEYFDSAGEADWSPRYNVAPTQPVPVIRQNPKEPRRELSLARWGLIPWWARDSSGAASMINARSETAAVKPAFRDALKFRRCLIPADGFYEWVRHEVVCVIIRRAPLDRTCHPIGSTLRGMAFRKRIV